MSETGKLLSDIRAYLRISAAAALRVYATKILDTYEKALIYSKLDGKTSQKKIEQVSGVPQTTISSWLPTFIQAGLVSPPDEYNESHRALFTLQELGIDLTTLKRSEKAAKPSPEIKSTEQESQMNEAQRGPIQKYLGEEKDATKQ